MPKVYFRDSGLRNMALNRFYDFNSRDDQGGMIENYVYKRLSGLYDRDHIKYWRTADKKEIDFIISTSYREGFAIEVKMKCKSGKSTTKKVFTGAYPAYPLELISYDMDPGCKWILKL